MILNLLGFPTVFYIATNMFGVFNCHIIMNHDFLISRINGTFL